MQIRQWMRLQAVSIRYPTRKKILYKFNPSDTQGGLSRKDFMLPGPLNSFRFTSTILKVI
jgi:hypothetical protein